MATERDFQVQVIRAAKVLGLVVYHTYDSRRSESGYPDLTIVGGSGVLFRELKSDRGRTSPAQKYWLAALSAAGADADVWRPADWPRILCELQALGKTTIPRIEPTPAEVRRWVNRSRPS